MAVTGTRPVPVRLVASLHDTSIPMIERNYSRFIAEYADEHARAALLDSFTPAPSDVDNVVPIRLPS